MALKGQIFGDAGAAGHAEGFVGHVGGHFGDLIFGGGNPGEDGFDVVRFAGPQLGHLEQEIVRVTSEIDRAFFRPGSSVMHAYEAF